MIVYVYSGTFFKKIFLPTKVMGVYPVFYGDHRLLLNIEEINGKWHIKPNENGTVYVGKDMKIEPELVVNTPYLLSYNNISYCIMATPIYNPNPMLLKATKDSFTVGATSTNDVSFNSGYVKDQEFKITNTHGKWHIESFTNGVYVNDKLIKKYQLLSGDYIFCHGLKMVLVQNRFLVTSSIKGISFNRSTFVTDSVRKAEEGKPIYNLLDDTPLYNKDSYFLKSPRFIPDMDDVKVVIDPPPEEQRRSDMPVILTVGPQLTMMCTSILSISNIIIEFAEGTVEVRRFVISVSTVGVMILGILMWPLITRAYNNHRLKKLEKKRQAKYKQYLKQKKQQILNIKLSQKEVLNEKNPPLDNYRNIIENRKSTLWERSIDEDDFLNVCLGIGNVKSRIKINNPEDHFSLEDKDKLLSSLQAVVAEAKYIENAPYTMSLADNNLVAVVGEKLLTDKFLDQIFLQIMTYCAYSDLKIIVYSNKETASRWDYLKILPHCWDDQHSTRYFATSLEEFNEVTQSIDKTFDARRVNDQNARVEDNGDESSEGKPDYVGYKPYYLIFTDDISAIRNTSLIKKVLNYRRNLGFSLIIENDRLSTLPDQTNNFISINKDVSALITNRVKSGENNQFRVNFNTNIDMYYCAQLLANIPILLEKGKYELPASLPFLKMYNVGRIEQLNSMDRWKKNNPVNSLSVPVGVDQDGETFKMDIHEKAHGPHGLIAGTTGSGKSEWIVTYILSLAVNFSPDELQFVLIDYKGGGLAMSFENKELGIKLPHLAGTITNLDKSAINRSIVSIESELKRRQTMFNDAREKLKEGQMDIYKYQQFYRKGMVDKPLSHLLIICDEFAELKQQEPDFMDQLISTSRIGRSLGVHLILATQKPSGVVNDQIWSNSRFKVCLRVQDKVDSSEILKKPDAAYLKQVGAFYFEVGNDEIYNLGQSAWAGAKYYPSDIVTTVVDQSVQYINNVGKVVSFYVSEKEKEQKNVKSEGEQLLNIVSYINEIEKTEKFVKQQLWLPNLPAIINLADIKKKYNHKAKVFDFTTIIGEYDEPRRQEQSILSVDLAAGNIAIVGQPGSGKEFLISTIMFSSITEHTPRELNYYVLDFGAETLRKFSRFPHVGEVVFQGDSERIVGVIQLIVEELEKRKELFQDYNGSFTYYNKHSGKYVPLIAIVINGFDVFSETLAKVADSLESLFRDGPRYGIIFILSASAQNTFRTRLLQYFNRFIVMNLKDESQYRNLTNCRRGLMPSNLYGRGICKIAESDDSYCEFQTARIIEPEKEIEYLNRVSDKLYKAYKFRAKRLTTIPNNVTSDDLIKYITTMKEIPIGYNFYEKDIAKLDLSNAKIYPIIMKNLKSNINFIYALSNLLTKMPNTVVRVIDVASIFDKPILDIKLFKDELDVIFAALANDVKTRTETQPLAINIILGVGVVKNKLSATGQKFADEMFNGMINAKQNIFILVDEYSKFKLLKLQPWYNAMDTTKGIWLGAGIDTQSVIVSNELSEEDKKYNFEGMAYVVDNSNYTLIKTMMDGDD